MSDYGYPEDQEVTEQGVFDHVLHHLRRQGVGSFRTQTPGGPPLCVYRGADGEACAAGCLIPDYLFDEVMETNSFSSILFPGKDAWKEAKSRELVARMSQALRTRFGHVVSLVASLQMAHDEYLVGAHGLNPLEKLARWEEEMEITAGNFDFSYTPPEAT